MNCTDAQQHLSAYYDDELTEDVRLRVSAHVQSCVACARELEHMQQLSNMVSTLVNPSTPPAIWRSVGDQLDPRPAPARLAAPRARRLSGWPLLALAASVFLAVGVSWIVFHAPSAIPSHDHRQFAADFGQYLEHFQRDPDAAQQYLVAKYENSRVSPEQAVQQVGYRPAVAAGLPGGYTVASTYVMKMPCCTCVQSVCQRDDGSSFAIFEHDDREPSWFSNRHETRAVCAGKDCCLVNLDERLAASWKRGDRHITLIGVTDRNELNRMVAWLDKIEDSDAESVGE